jgi:muramoyltetrapeptide carboxypeptidase LdcA involved in peptidoglycan recycling
MLELTPLQPEDQVAIIAPAGSMASERIEAGIVALQAAGLNPVVFDQAYLQTGRYDGTPAQRVAALHEAFETPLSKPFSAPVAALAVLSCWICSTLI